MQPDPVFDHELVSRYNQPGPRYTSYPTAVQFTDRFGSEHYQEHARLTNENLVPAPLSLYVHLPFCRTVCYYCACNKIVTNNRKRADSYLDVLHREIEMQGFLYDSDREVNQLHWGGGTPTFISKEQMEQLMLHIRTCFSLHDDDKGEYSVELDPRECDEDIVRHLRSLGFNRISLGIQDFDEKVQKAVNRIQGEDETRRVIESARQQGFKSISVDLIYGLPHQSVESFRVTLEKILRMSPDRLSIFNYAHMPSRFKVQRQISESDLPAPSTKLEILKNNISTLTEAGYVYIGMDHFAKPDDELAIAQNNDRLTRNFQGYSTHGDCDIIGMGVSAISKIGNCYAQNHHDLPEYSERVESGEVPVLRGYKLDNDDLLRQYVILQLICHSELKFEDVEERYLVDFEKYFYNEIQCLKIMQDDGLLEIGLESITILPPGRLLVRNICMTFDKYLRQSSQGNTFSRAI